jgi:hypothetical protein
MPDFKTPDAGRGSSGAGAREPINAVTALMMAAERVEVPAQTVELLGWV